MTNVKFSRKPFEGTFNTLVDDLMTELPVFFNNGFNQNNRKGFVPVNVKETEKSYHLEVVAPGFEKTDFKIDLDQQVLTISGASAPLSTSTSLNADKKNENEKSIRTEYNKSSFKRSFTLDEKIDATKIEASYINGVLTLNLPKKEVVKASATEIIIK